MPKGVPIGFEMAEKNVNRQTDRHFRIYISRDIMVNKVPYNIKEHNIVCAFLCFMVKMRKSESKSGVGAQFRWSRSRKPDLESES